MDARTIARVLVTHGSADCAASGTLLREADGDGTVRGVGGGASRYPVVSGGDGDCHTPCEGGVNEIVDEVVGFAAHANVDNLSWSAIIAQEIVQPVEIIPVLRPWPAGPVAWLIAH